MQQLISRDLIFLLGDVARLLRTRVDQVARGNGMTRAQWVILARLEWQPGVNQAELAALCEVEPITVARLVDRLEARDLVERRPDPTDRRVRRLYLRPAAQPILAAIHQYRASFSGLLTEGLDPAQENLLIETLLHIKTNIVSKSIDLDLSTHAAE